MPAAGRGSADAALADLHRDYSRKLYSYALSILRSREDAEDAVQTTFMNAYGSLLDGRVPRQEASWLFRIAKNVCLNRIRTGQRKPAQSLDGMDVVGVSTVHDQLEQQLHMRALRIAIDKLPPQQRRAIIMREMEGASYVEIAQALDTTQSAVESLIFRARRQIQASMRAAAAGADAASGAGAMAA
jgi:RNA polymerase sigma factor (sigma-70 family)